MPTILNLYIIALLVSFIVTISTQAVHKRFEYKFSFKGPYLAQKDNQVPFWTYSGSAIASDESFRITPSLRSQKGQAWAKNPTSFDWWEMEVVFRVNGRGRIGADGLALWFTKMQGVEGPVFGSSDKWTGLSLFFDSFDNDNKRNNPYIMGMVNNGSIIYDHENDGSSQQLGGCLRDFRNKPFPIRAKIEYYKNILTVRVQQLEFDYSPIDPANDRNDVYRAFYHEPGLESRSQQQLFLERFSPSPSVVRPQGKTSEEDLEWFLVDDAFEFLGEARRKLLLFGDNDYVALDDLDEEGKIVKGGAAPSPTRSEDNDKRAKKKRPLSKKRKRRGKGTKRPLPSKSENARPSDSPPKAVYIHNGMTDNEKDYEICFRAESIVLPSSGYFGVTAATGGLADDHDVLKFLVHSLRSPEEMAQLRLNKEEEDRFQREFEEYQEKTKKARDDYIAQNPDAARRDEDLYETSEQRELRQIFQGQAQIFDVLRQLNSKLDDIVGKQDIAMGVIPGRQAGAGQPVQAGQLPSGTDGISRNEVSQILTNQRELVQNVRELKTTVADVHSKSGAILINSQKPQGSVQPVGGGVYDFHVTLKELNEGLNIVKRDLSLANQRLGAVPQGSGSVAGCPQVTCVSTALFVVLMVTQIVLLIGYFIYRDSKEAKAKKFY